MSANPGGTNILTITKTGKLPKPLDQTIREFVAHLEGEAERLKAFMGEEIETRRKIAELVREKFARGGPEMVSVTDMTLANTGLRIRIYVPDHITAPGCMLYLHGGGWVLFSIKTHDRLMREYAHRAGCVVVGLDYSLAPENQFPHQLEEIVTCINWLRAEGPEHGIPVEKLFLGGDSVGGNMSLSSAMIMRDTGAEELDGLLLNYAALDTEPRPSYELYDGPPYMLNGPEMAGFWKAYLGDIRTISPYARPLLANKRGLPPVHMCVAECDILVDENRELRNQLHEAGVEVSFELYAGASHSFLEAVSVSDIAEKAVQTGADWLKKQLLK